MKLNELKKLHAGNNFTHVSVGNPATFTGKLFVKNASEATATEISFGALESGQEIPFLHYHKQNEETYIIISGEGDFTIDKEVFPIEAGSLIRISPDGIRTIKCTSSESLRYICIQAKSNSLEQCTMSDGVIVG